MEMSRRRFFGSISAIGGLALISNLSCAKGPFESMWEGVRDQFNLDRHFIHMSGFFLASHPKPVKQAIDRHRHGLDKNPVRYYRENFRKSQERARLSAAEYLNTDPSQIALTDSTTMGLSLLYTGIKVNEDQEMLTTEDNYYSTSKQTIPAESFSDIGV